MDRTQHYWRQLLLVVALGGVTTSASQADKPRPLLFSMGRFTGAWAGRPRSYDEAIWDHMVTIGATASGTGLAWVDGEPEQGVYDWDRFDYADFCVDGIRSRGMEVAFFTGLTPQWAQLHPELEPHQTPPREDQDVIDSFMTFHTFVGDRYKGKVKYYYFWNEPNGCSWINGCSNADSYPTYTRWLIRASQALKAGDPDAKIIAGRLDYHAGVSRGYEYVQGMYDHGAGPHIDGIAIHPYDWSGTIHWRALTDTRNVMVANGDAHKPIWITEYGWNSTDYQSTADKLVQVLTELKKPEWDFVEKANYLVLNDGSGVENYGLIDADLSSPRAGYYAFQNFDKTWPENVDFSADVTSGSPDLAVQFTDHSTVTDIQSWLWEFGDGETSAEQNPAHTYSQEGSFTVRLTVTTSEGTNTAEKTNYIRVTHLPSVAFIGGQVPPTASDSQIVAHLESLGLAVDVYDDDPGNRPTAQQIAATHDVVVGSSTLLSANVAGEFRNESVPFIYWESALSMSDREALADGPDIDGGQTQINVIDNAHPVMAGLPSGVVTVTNSGANYSRSTGPIASGARVLATNVNDPDRRMVIVAEPGAELLDGGVAVGQRAFLFLYDTTWLDTNDTGKQILDNAVAWMLGPVQAGFEASVTSGYVPLTVEFTDLSTGPVSSWSWDFGDTGISSVRHPSYTYDQPGTYDVTLTVAGVGQNDSITRTAYVVVYEPVRPDFDGDRDVDLADFGHLQACYTGPLAGPPDPGCEDADFDGDNHIDQDDFTIFQACMSGPNIMADPTCDD